MDIAVRFSVEGDWPRADWAMLNGDLARDEGLSSRVAVSLFTDATARADDALPDGGTDRRGWWGDVPVDGDVEDGIGSLLWLLAREKALPATLLRAQEYARQALAWAQDSRVAAAVDVAAEFAGTRGDQLRMRVTLRRTDGEKPDPRFDFLWSRSP